MKSSERRADELRSQVEQQERLLRQRAKSIAVRLNTNSLCDSNSFSAVMIVFELFQDLEERLECRDMDWRKQQQIHEQREEQYQQTIMVSVNPFESM